MDVFRKAEIKCAKDLKAGDIFQLFGEYVTVGHTYSKSYSTPEKVQFFIKNGPKPGIYNIYKDFELMTYKKVIDPCDNTEVVPGPEKEAKYLELYDFIEFANNLYCVTDRRSQLNSLYPLLFELYDMKNDTHAKISLSRNIVLQTYTQKA